MIKAGIFDVGGVLMTHDDKEIDQDIQRTFNLSAKKVGELIQQYGTDLQSGKISEDEFIKKLSKETRTSPIVQTDLLAEGLARTIKPQNDVRKIIKQLKRRMQLSILSNTVASHAVVLRKEKIFEDFDHIFLSFELGYVKPDPRIYEHVLSRLNIKPEEAFFVDDRRENVLAASELGIRGFHFRSAGELIQDLRKLHLVL